jgi:glycerate dehydrogenase
MSQAPSLLPHIVVLDGFTLNPGDNPWNALQQLGKVTIYDRADPSELIRRAREADVLVINKVRLSAPDLAQLPRLRFIAVTATGYDCVDVQAASQQGIVVSNVPVYGTSSVAQLTMAHLLHLCHRIDLHDAAVRSGEWQKAGEFSFWKIPLVELAEKTLGIVGWGRIGRQVGHLGRALGMHVIAASARRRPPDLPVAQEEVTRVDLNSLFAQADVVSLHCPLTEQTRGLVDRDRLQRMKRTALLINVSRGGLVVEHDLADALNAGIIAGAGLDVVSSEPILPDNPLLSARNCFITPHLAWATVEARRRLMQTTVANVSAFLAGRPQNVVNSRAA